MTPLILYICASEIIIHMHIEKKGIYVGNWGAQAYYYII